jgi:hypothetical protein
MLHPCGIDLSEIAPIILLNDVSTFLCNSISNRSISKRSEHGLILRALRCGHDIPGNMSWEDRGINHPQVISALQIAQVSTFRDHSGR